MSLIESIKVRNNELFRAFQSGEDFIYILNDNKVGVSNYTEFVSSYEKVALSIEAIIIRELFLEECFIILTIIWRSDYANGGGTLDRHKDVIAQCRKRIISILGIYE